ncbi:hypothetical protein ACFL52_01645 [Candidatus Margulisiibacteriota bacterium]
MNIARVGGRYNMSHLFKSRLRIDLNKTEISADLVVKEAYDTKFNAYIDALLVTTNPLQVEKEIMGYLDSPQGREFTEKCSEEYAEEAEEALAKMDKEERMAKLDDAGIERILDFIKKGIKGTKD